MSKAEDRALEAYPIESHEMYDDLYRQRNAYVKGYRQAEKDTTEVFARLIRGNLSMIDEKVQVKFEQLYTEITGEKMYKGFID